jgi:hypothetical protein
VRGGGPGAGRGGPGRGAKAGARVVFFGFFSWLGVICIGGLSLGGETAFYVRFRRERE